MKFIQNLLLLTTLLGVGCTRATLPTPEAAFREIDAFSINDDLNLEGLSDAITTQRNYLLASPDKLMQFGTVVVDRKAYAESLDRLNEVLRSDISLDEKRNYLSKNFRFLQLYGGSNWGEVLLTGYFEPVLRGSLQRTEKFSQPLYARPADLVSVELKKFADRFASESTLRGRLNGTTVVPYFSREEIDGKHALSGKGLELCWVDPIDAFFLHIQGSGTIQLEDGRELFLTFAEKNGLKYEAIGKFLRDQISPRQITMQAIERVLHSMTLAERFKVLFLNPSYVFFQISIQRAITAIGVPATPGRTIASDPKFIPKGALAVLTFKKPPSSEGGEVVETEDPISRLVVDQDTGGAIKGTDHIDLFWGRGDEAKKVAGVLQARAQIVYLVPHTPSITLQQSKPRN